MGFRARFTDHPAEVGETYWEHQKVAFGFSRCLFRASMQAAVHAVFPWLCRTSASDCIRQLNDQIVAGGRGRLATEDEQADAEPGSQAEPGPELELSAP